MLLKRITRLAVEDAAGYLFLIACQYAYSVVDPEGNKTWQKLTGPKLSGMNASFTANTGLAHGGNGFEAVQYLMKYFQETGLDDPALNEDALKASGIDVAALADRTVRENAEFKAEAKAGGSLRVKPLPCINHPVFVWTISWGDG